MKSMRWIVLIALTFSVASSELACRDKSPLQNAGESVDTAVDDITHPGEGPVEKAVRKTGEKIDAVADDISE